MRRHALLLGAALLLSTSAAYAQAPPPAAAPAPPLGAAAPVPAPPPPVVLVYVQEPPAHRSKGMMIAGIVLTSFAASLALATVAVVACCNKTDNDGISAADTLGPILGLSSLLPAAVGIPLWVVGARPPAPPEGVPVVSAGPGGVGLRWTF